VRRRRRAAVFDTRCGLGAKGIYGPESNHHTHALIASIHGGSAAKRIKHRVEPNSNLFYTSWTSFV
jgi:hypothetical protein